MQSWLAKHKQLARHKCSTDCPDLKNQILTLTAPFFSQQEKTMQGSCWRKASMAWWNRFNILILTLFHYFHQEQTKLVYKIFWISDVLLEIILRTSCLGDLIVDCFSEAQFNHAVCINHALIWDLLSSRIFVRDTENIKSIQVNFILLAQNIMYLWLEWFYGFLLQKQEKKGK